MKKAVRDYVVLFKRSKTAVVGFGEDFVKEMVRGDVLEI